MEKKKEKLQKYIVNKKEEGKVIITFPSQTVDKVFLLTVFLFFKKYIKIKMSTN